MRTSGIAAVVGFLFAALCAPLVAQTNPIPHINNPLVPGVALPRGLTGFTLTVNGAGFVAGSVVKWNGSARATTFDSNTKQLTAQILSSDIATTRTILVTVSNPPPGGGTSDAVFFEVTTPTTSIAVVRTDSPSPSTNGATGLTEGDFDGDGIPDLAIANSACLPSSGCLLMRAVISFVNNGHFPVGQRLMPDSLGAIANEDFNGDGFLDLVTIGGATRTMPGPTLSVLLGDGTSNFPSNSDYQLSSGLFLNNLATGDFNRDGQLDLVGASDSVVYVFLGNGDGTFALPVSYAKATGGSAGMIAVGDFNGDGILDLAVSNFTDSTVSILLGNGNGTFQPHVDYPTDLCPDDIAGADINGDGKLDLAVMTSCGSTVSILLGNGDGTFQPMATYPAGRDAGGITVGDYNGDGKLDLATADAMCFTSCFANGAVEVFFGRGDGTFQSHVDFPSGAGSGTIASADFVGNGRLAFATLNFVDNTVSVFSQVPAIAVSSPSLVFANQTVGTTSGSQNLTITNSGSAALGAGIAITGSDSGDFSIAASSTCQIPSATIQPGTSCDVSVTFSPQSGGQRSASLSITNNATGGFQSVSLLGNGIGPSQVNFTATSLMFESQNVGTTSASQSITATNPGPGSLNNIGIALDNTAEFSVTTTCGTTLAQGASCSITVKFSPSTSGARAGTITFNNSSTSGVASLLLTGTGIGPANLNFVPASLTFPDQVVGTTSTSQSITMTNPGPGGVINVSLGLINTADSSMTNTCGSSLVQGASCAITVTFHPSATGSPRAGVVTINDSDPNSPHSLQVTGNGTNFSIAPITGSSSSATVTAGQPAIYQLSLSPQVFSGPVTLSCAKTTTIPNTTCTIAPANPVMLSGTGATPVTVTVTTKSHSGMAVPTQMRRFLRPNVLEVQTIRVFSYLLVLLVMIVALRKGWKRARLALSAAFLLAMLVTGCGAGGNGGGGSNPPPSGSAGTPAGTYQLLVTASSSGVTRTMTLSLTVQ